MRAKEMAARLLAQIEGRPLAGGAVVVAVHLAAAFLSMLPIVYTGGDNGAYLALAHTLANEGSYQEMWHPWSPIGSGVPPLYPAVLSLLILAGAQNLLVFKALSACLTAVSVLFCFLWMRKLQDGRAALVVALLFGMSPGVLDASQWVLTEPLFLALANATLWVLTPVPATASSRASPSGSSSKLRWHVLLAGIVLAVAALMTRRAGVILVASMLPFLALRRHWISLGLLAGGGLMLTVHRGYFVSLWEAVGQVTYFAPELEREGFAEMAGRVLGNTWSYATEFVPQGIAGLDGRWAAAAGLVLSGLALAGWIRALRKGPGLAGVFFGLHWAALVVWPGVMSSTRYALPMLPLVLCYASQALTAGTTAARWLSPVIARGLRMAGAAVILLLAAIAWSGSVQEARTCRSLIAEYGPWSCWGGHYVAYHHALLWSEANLPAESSILARKPRLVHLYTGLQSHMFSYPLSRPGFVRLTAPNRTDHYMHSNWDNLSLEYMEPFILANPDFFCRRVRFRTATDDAVTIFAIRRPDEVGEVSPLSPLRSLDEVPVCSDQSDTIPNESQLTSMAIPLLAR